MLYYIESAANDPYFNLALEQLVFDRFDRAHSYFMLWQNHNSIIVGKHQNTAEEISASFVRQHNISVARRLSGGGAVYHDLGNLNFTFITDESQANFDFSMFCRPIVAALASMGVNAEISGRNDMTIDGRKFSGNAQYSRGGRVMHHGTILYDSDLEMLSKALNVSGDKFVSKGVASVRGRVTNVKPHMRAALTVREFWDALRMYIAEEFDMRDREVTPEELAYADKLKNDIYSKWIWNYGKSPSYTLHRQRRVEGCGKIELLLDVGEEGFLKSISVYGDFFSQGDPQQICEKLRGCRLRETDIRTAMADIDVPHYFKGLQAEQLINLILD